MKRISALWVMIWIMLSAMSLVHASVKVGDGDQTKSSLIVYASSSGYVLESKQIEHGHFSYSLIKGLQGAADKNDDQEISAIELAEYATAETKRISDNLQIPIYKLTGVDDLMVCGASRTYLLAVGINQYQSLEIGETFFSVKDANLIAGAIEKNCPNIAITILRNDDATRMNILKKINMIKAQIGQNDNFIFYFSGMGTKTANGSVLCANDTDTDLLRFTGISHDDLLNLIDGIKANTILLVDASISSMFTRAR